MKNESMVSRRWVVAGLLAGAASPVLAHAPAASPRPQPRPLRGAVSAGALVEAARLGGSVGFMVADARSGAVLEVLNPQAGLPPASVAKAMTTLYALDRLGAGYRFTTRLIATGPVSGGRVQGDLVLAGGGDPTLSTDALGDMAAELRARGITGITGRFGVYGGALPAIAQIDPGQPPHVSYNPAISGLNLNYNRVHFEWKRGQAGYDIRMDARAERYRPQVNMARMRVVDRADPLYTYSDAGGAENWTVAARALGQDGSRWLPVRRPEIYAGEVFQVLAAGQGIALPGPVVLAQPPRGAVLAEHSSGELAGLLREMMRWSTNLTAEAVGLTASGTRGGAGALAASGRVMSDWAAARFGLSGARFVDHSGLGGASHVSPADMVTALLRHGPDGPLRGLMRAHPLRDAKGNEVKTHPLKVSAKTGTLNFVSGLAGFVRTPGGADLAFAVFAADPARRDRLPEAERERPPGGREWTLRARTLQQGLIERWATLYG